MTQARTSLPPAWDKFTQRDDNGTVFALSLQIVLYANRPLSELATGAIACHELLLGQFGAEFQLYHASSMRNPRPFTDKYADVFATLCRKKGHGLPSYRVFKGSSLQDYGPPAFATGAYATHSWLQIHLPPLAAQDWPLVWALLSRMALPFPFRFGTVGYALCWNELSVNRDVVVPKLIGPLLKRHPGLNVGTPRELCDQAMPPVNWVTLLGPQPLETLGGIPGLQQAFAGEPRIQVAALGEGVVIRAGEAPQVGGRNRKDDVPLYRRVGAQLKGLRQTQEIELYGLTLEESEAWLARFDQ